MIQKLPWTPTLLRKYGTSLHVRAGGVGTGTQMRAIPPPYIVAQAVPPRAVWAGEDLAGPVVRCHSKWYVSGFSNP